MRPLADRDLLDEWHQIVRDAFGVLANLAALMRADRVEVAKEADIPLVLAGRLGDVGKDLLVEEL